MSAPLQHLVVDHVKIALRQRTGNKKPGLVWLGGYMSDMLGTKAIAVDEWAAKHDHTSLRFDYSGHGESEGDFYQGNISIWLKQALAVYQAFCEGPQVLLGSSMGGWVALRLCQELKKRGHMVSGIILIAPAPDFTKTLIEPNLTDEQKQLLESQGFFTVKTPYGEEPYSKTLIEDGVNNLIMTGLFDPGCPIHIIQGMQDSEVPYEHTMELLNHLPLNDVTLTLVRDGDHSLSRPQDLALLYQALDTITAD